MDGTVWTLSRPEALTSGTDTTCATEMTGRSCKRGAPIQGLGHGDLAVVADGDEALVEGGVEVGGQE